MVAFTMIMGSSAAVLALEMQAGTPVFIFGTDSDTPTVIGFGGYEWLTLWQNSSALTLLARNHNFGTSQFNVGAGSLNFGYAGGLLHAAMQNIHASVVNAKEQALVSARDLDWVIGNSWFSVETMTNQYFWPLSYFEAASLNSNTLRAFGTIWWLRSPHSAFEFFNPKIVDYWGGAGGSMPGHEGFYNAVRPAFNLNISNVLFTSAASGANAKPATIGGPLAATAALTGAVKFTIVHPYQTLNVSATSAQSTQSRATLTFSYANATTGANQFVSAVLEQSGSVLYYGKLVQISSAAQASGTLSIPLAGVADGTYTLSIFSEEANGDNFTDFASTPVNMTLTVLGGIGTVSNFGGTIISDNGGSSTLSGDNDITAFTIPGQVGNTIIRAGTIELIMPRGTDVTNLTPTITHTGASISPVSGVAQNFTAPVTYTVTALNGSTQNYIVTVSLRTERGGCNSGAGNVTFLVMTLAVIFFTNILPGIRKKK